MRFLSLSSLLIRLKQAAGSGHLSRLAFGLLITFVLAGTAYRFRSQDSSSEVPPSTPVEELSVPSPPSSLPDTPPADPPPTPVSSPVPAPGPGPVRNLLPAGPVPPGPAVALPPPAPPRPVRNDAYYAERHKHRARALDYYEQLFQRLNNGNP